MKKNVAKLIYRIRKTYGRIRCLFLITKWRLYGMSIGTNVSISTFLATWPHQVKIGDNCTIESNVYFKFDGIWRQGPSIIVGNNVFIGKDVEFNIKDSIVIESNTLIGSGSRFIDHDHGIETNQLIRSQLCPTEKIHIKENVWIGANVIVLKGCVIEAGVVVAAGAVVTRSVPANEIWGGVPAKKIGTRMGEHDYLKSV